MKSRIVFPLVVGAFLIACGDSNPPPAAPTPPPPDPPAPMETASVAPPPAPTVAPPPQPTADEQKKIDEKNALDADRAAWTTSHQKEMDRWTPDFHAQAKALADKSFPNGHAALVAAVASKTRMPGDADRDKYRHPVETLDFFGVQPNMTVIDVGPGEGWYTEILAPVLQKKGHYIATGGDPNGPPDSRGTFNAQKFRGFLDTAPELYSNAQMIAVDGKAPQLPQTGTVDMVLLMREVHGMINSGTLDAWLKEINKALKPNGVLGVEEHRAKPDADPKESSKKGYVPEKYVIDTIEAAGFKLSKKADINANAKDTKDYSEGVWALPPSYRNGDKDKDKYAAIGESDRMTLKFVKVSPAAPKK